MSLIIELLKNLTRKPITSDFPRSMDGLNFPINFRGHHTIDQELCIGCRRCMRVCPAFAIVMVDLSEEELSGREDKKKVKPLIRLSDCIYCGECEDVCPKQAIDLRNKFVPASEDLSTLVVG